MPKSLFLFSDDGITPRIGDLGGVELGVGDIVVRQTWIGDTDLDGYVDGLDAANAINGEDNGLTGWSNGDFNYDGTVDSGDFAALESTIDSYPNAIDFDAVVEGVQQTQFLYGSFSGSLGGITGYVYSNDLLRAIVSPNAATGLVDNGGGGLDSYTYDALGERRGYLDRDGNTHVYAYDAMGRMTSDTVTSTVLSGTATRHT